MDEIAELEKRLEILKRRQGILETQRAVFGFAHVPVHLELEIEDTLKQIDNLLQQLQILKSNSATVKSQQHSKKIFTVRLPLRELIKDLNNAEISQQWDEVIEIGKEILELDVARRGIPKKIAAAYRERGSLYNHEGQYELAIHDYSQAILYDPTNAFYYFERGINYKIINKLDESIEDFTKGIHFKSSDGAYYYERGRVLKIKGDYELARYDFQKAFELKYGNSVEELKELAKIYITLLKERNDINSQIAITGLKALDKLAVESLIDAFNVKENKLTATLAIILGEIGDKKAIEPLINKMEYAGFSEQLYIIRAIGKFNDIRAETYLFNILYNWNTVARWWVIEDLGINKVRNAIQPLINLLTNESSEVRYRAAQALGNIKSLEAIEPLIEALLDDSPQVRYLAAWSLGEIGHGKALFALTKLQKEDTAKTNWGKTVQDSASEAIQKINASPTIN